MPAKLTEQAELRLAALSDAVEEAHARLLANQRRVNALEDQRRKLDENNEEAFEALTAEIERVSRKRDIDSLAFQQQMRLLTAVKMWVQQTPANCELRDVEQNRKLQSRKSSESTDEDIDQCREDIERVRGARASVARAVPPIEDLHAAAVAHVETLAARGRPTITVDGGRLVIRHGNGKSFAPGGEEVAVAAWLHPEAMVERLRQQINEVHEAEVRRKVPVMSTADRDKRLAVIDAELLRLEHEEEFLIEVGEQYGFVVPRRENADPRAILGVSVHRRERAVA